MEDKQLYMVMRLIDEASVEFGFFGYDRKGDVSLTSIPGMVGVLCVFDNKVDAEIHADDAQIVLVQMSELDDKHRSGQNE